MSNPCLLRLREWDWEAVAALPPGSCFLHSRIEQEQLTVLLPFPSTWLCLLCAISSGYHLSMDAQSPCLYPAPKTRAVIDDRSARDGPLNFLFFHGEIANFLEFNSRQRANFIYYFGAKCWIVMNCATHWTGKIFICGTVLLAFFPLCQGAYLQQNVNLSWHDILIQINATEPSLRYLHS